MQIVKKQTERKRTMKKEETMEIKPIAMKKYKIRPGSIADVMRDILSGLALGAILVYIVYFVSLYA